MTVQRPSGPTISWGWLSTGLGVFSAACLSTLVVVVAIKNIDILSTAALALAVLAFSAQLIVTMAQGQQFGQLNADTKSALTEMRATTSSLLTNQREQFDRVLKYALREVVPAAVEDVSGAEDAEQAADQGERAAELEGALQSRFEQVFADVDWLRPSSAEDRDIAYLSPRPSNYSRRKRDWEQLLSQYPSRKEGETVVAVISQLSPRAISMLGRIIGDIGEAGRADRSVSYLRSKDGTFSPGITGLLEAGLLETVPPPPHVTTGRSTRFRLTPTGIVAAQLLRGKDEPPDWAAALK